MKLWNGQIVEVSRISFPIKSSILWTSTQIFQMEKGVWWRQIRSMSGLYQQKTNPGIWWSRYISSSFKIIIFFWCLGTEEHPGSVFRRTHYVCYHRHFQQQWKFQEGLYFSSEENFKFTQNTRNESGASISKIVRWP